MTPKLAKGGKLFAEYFGQVQKDVKKFLTNFTPIEQQRATLLRSVASAFDDLSREVHDLRVENEELREQIEYIKEFLVL